MTDERVLSICQEYGIEIIDGRSYPDIRQTRAVVTMERILRSRGEAHFRMVMSTLAETDNNQGQLASSFWSMMKASGAAFGIGR